MRDFAAEAEPIRERLSALALRLPEAEALPPTSHHRAFAVRGKKFCYFLVDHHGDGRIAINVKVAPGVLEELVAHEPERFHVPAYLGAKGWAGFAFRDAPADGAVPTDWDEVNEMVRQSYALIAPKRLVAQMEPPAG